MSASRFFYGGQAVIEGVMIRGQRFYSVAVRRPARDIRVQCWPIPTLYTGRWRRVPFVRGVIVLVETLVLGMQALSYSANANLDEGQEMGKWSIGLTLAVAMLVAVGLFLVVPLFLVHSLDRYMASSLLSNLVEGIIRLAIFLAYLVGIAMIGEVRRVFAYHGAEHMTVHAHEAGRPMTVESVRPFSTAHPRCGTAFLLVVLVVAIIVFAFLGRPAMPLRIASRVLLLPVIAGVGYEVIRFSGAHAANALVRAVMAPSLALQALTTRRPDDGQIQVAIRAMEAALAADRGEEQATAALAEGETPAQGAGAPGPPKAEGT